MIQKTNKNFMRDLWDMGPFPSIPNWLHAWLSGIMIKESSKKPRGQLNYSSCSQTAGRLVTGHYLFQRSFQGQFWNINDHKIPPSLIPPRSKVFLPKVPGLLRSFCYSKTYTCCHSFWKVFFFFFFKPSSAIIQRDLVQEWQGFRILVKSSETRKFPILALWVCCLACSTKESLLLLYSKTMDIQWENRGDWARIQFKSSKTSFGSVVTRRMHYLFQSHFSVKDHNRVTGISCLGWEAIL